MLDEGYKPRDGEVGTVIGPVPASQALTNPLWVDPRVPVVVVPPIVVPPVDVAPVFGFPTSRLGGWPRESKGAGNISRIRIPSCFLYNPLPINSNNALLCVRGYSEDWNNNAIDYLDLSRSVIFRGVYYVPSFTGADAAVPPFLTLFGNYEQKGQAVGNYDATFTLTFPGQAGSVSRTVSVVPAPTGSTGFGAGTKFFVNLPLNGYFGPVNQFVEYQIDVSVTTPKSFVYLSSVGVPMRKDIQYYIYRGSDIINNLNGEFIFPSGFTGVQEGAVGGGTDGVRFTSSNYQTNFFQHNIPSIENFRHPVTCQISGNGSKMNGSAGNYSVGAGTNIFTTLNGSDAILLRGPGLVGSTTGFTSVTSTALNSKVTQWCFLKSTLGLTV